MEAKSTIHFLSGEHALDDARRDWKGAFGQLTGPIPGWLSAEGTLVWGKEAVFTRLVSRIQAWSAEGAFEFPTAGDEVPEDRLESRYGE